MFGIKTRIKNYLSKRYGVFDDLVTFRINPVGYYCNHACPMCWRMNLTPEVIREKVKQDQNSLRIDEYENLFASIPKSVKFVDIVGGGEPLLYPKINELFGIIKKKNIYGRLITNGTLISDQIAQSLVANSWDMVRISFHAGSKEVYARVNGAPNFDKVVRNIRLLKIARGSNQFPKISLHFVIQKWNYRNLKQFVVLAESLGVDELQFDYLIPFNMTILLSEKEREWTIKELRSLRRNIRIPHNIDQVIRMFETHPKWGAKKTTKGYFAGRYCELVQGNLDMSCEGNVAPCCIAFDDITGFSIRSRALADIWKDMKKFRRELRDGKFHSFCYKYCNFDLPAKEPSAAR